MKAESYLSKRWYTTKVVNIVHFTEQHGPRVGDEFGAKLTFKLFGIIPLRTEYLLECHPASPACGLLWHEYKHGFTPVQFAMASQEDVTTALERWYKHVEGIKAAQDKQDKKEKDRGIVVSKYKR